MKSTPTNPFIYGRILRLDDPACSRPELERAIARSFEKRERLALYGDRRLGKSTLVTRTLAAQKAPCLVIDLLGLKSIEGLCAVMVGALEEYVRQRSMLIRKITPWLREIGLDLKDIRLLLSRGGMHLEMSTAQSTDTLRRLLDRIGQLAERTPLAVFFDEFQEISDRLTAEDTRHVLGVMRSQIQRQSRVAYYFAGSAKASFTKLFLQEGAPFFEGAHLLDVQPISIASFRAFLAREFERSGKPASAAALETILGIAGERSADVQQLAHETWSMARDTPVTVSAVGRALLQIIGASESLALTLLDKSTALQQRALFAVALYQDQPLSQRELVRITRFRSPSSLRKALEHFLSGELPILEEIGSGRVRFRHRYLRLWFVLERTRAMNFLPQLTDPDEYQRLLPDSVRLLSAS
jgi:AAA+ ATPase superfamily predicted ATPase